jgi:hypothetical protein
LDVRFDIVTVLSFIISVLLVPAFIYIWKQHIKEVVELKAKVKSLENDVDKSKLDLLNTKTNYIERFARLNENINTKFVATNQSITSLAIEIREAITLLKNSNSQGNSKPN